MPSSFDLGLAAAAHLATEGQPWDFADVWTWAWNNYGEDSIDTQWGSGFYMGLCMTGYTVLGPLAVLEV